MRLRRRWRRWAVPVLLLLILLTLAVFLLCKLQPLIAELAVTRVSNQVNRLVAAAVNDALAEGDTSYSDLIHFEKDNNGQITAISSNMAACNRLKTLVETNAIERFADVSTSELQIPLGTLSGVALLSGRGPALKVKMQSVSSPTAGFENEFISAGINQTKHRIVLTVRVRISILLPGCRTATEVVSSYVVAETVIVGSVPESYTYFRGSETDVEDSIINDT